MHSLSSPAVLSVAASASAPGVLLANGNTGEYLDSNIDTFMSQDGGVNWKKVANGSSFYEIGDQGGLLVRVSEASET